MISVWRSSATSGSIISMISYAFTPDHLLWTKGGPGVPADRCRPLTAPRSGSAVPPRSRKLLAFEAEYTRARAEAGLVLGWGSGRNRGADRGTGVVRPAARGRR